MKKFLLNLLAILLIIEEWLWDALSACGHYLAQLFKLESVERWLTQVPPNTALLAIAIPVIVVTPLNLAALWLLLHGMLVQGLVMELVAKLLGTLLVARVFTLTKPQLFSFAALAWLYYTITGWLRWAHAKVVDLEIYRMAQVWKRDVKAQVKTWLA